MKKAIGLILTLAMVFSMCTVAYAATVGVGTSNVGEVTVSVVDGGTNAPTVYAVTVTWDALDFTYRKGATTSRWDPEKHGYDVVGGNNSWDNTSAGITVTNHSNIGIDVDMAFEGGGTSKTFNGVTATLGNPSFTLTTGVGLTYATASSGMTTVTVSNAPDVDTGFTIGMVTVTIADAA